MIGHVDEKHASTNRFAPLAKCDEGAHDKGEHVSGLEGTTEFKRELIIDSGAAETVIPRDFLPGLEKLPEVKRGKTFIAANGDKMRNFGEVSLKFRTQENAHQDKGLLFHVTEVKKAFVSVARITEQGNRVVFNGADDSYIENKTTKERIPLRPKGNVFVCCCT